MSEFHDEYPSYEHLAHHSEEDGKKIRRTLWNVFWVMLAITIFELVIGSMAPGHGWSGTLWIKVLFIGLTILKAGFIVMAFMHLGHEVKFMKYVVLMPDIIFMAYAIFIMIAKFAEFQGFLKFHLRRLRGQFIKPIEYKESN